MQLVIPINEFDINNVYFNHPIPNNVLDGSLFSRILYSDEYITFNGIYLGLNWKINHDSYISLKISNNEEDNINLNMFDINNNFDNEIDKNQLDLLNEEKDITSLIVIEEKILNKLNLKNKKKVLQVQEQIYSMFNNLKKKTQNQNIEHLESNHNYIFKCSGIWISEDTYGLTFKIIDNNFNHQ